MYLNMIDRDFALLLAGAGISLVSATITLVLQHFLSLREHRIKQRREATEQEAKELRAKLTQGIDEKPTVRCPACNTVHPFGTRFCRNCGKRLPTMATPPQITDKVKQGEQPKGSDNRVCKNCGHLNPKESIFCEDCGSPVLME